MDRPEQADSSRDVKLGRNDIDQDILQYMEMDTSRGGVSCVLMMYFVDVLVEERSVQEDVGHEEGEVLQDVEQQHVFGYLQHARHILHIHHVNEFFAAVQVQQHGTHNTHVQRVGPD